MGQLNDLRPLGATGVSVPPIIFGTSALGNLYRELPYETKLSIARSWFETVSAPVALDTAGKYGAGLAIEMIGTVLRDLGVDPADVLISNKLGWYRVPLTGSEPTFEPGVWKGLNHDAEQRIGYNGILSCFEQGIELLGAPYQTGLVSVHDPDEYLDAGGPRDSRFSDIVDAYRALGELKRDGKVSAVGVGAKDWTVIRELYDRVGLDWAMFACSLTIYTHSPELVAFMRRLDDDGVGVINSAVFNAGFLIGGDFFDYRPVGPRSDPELFAYRQAFFEVCGRHAVQPADACVEFGLSGPGVAAVALNTSNPRHIAANVVAIQSRAPVAFWNEMRDRGLIRRDYDFV